MDRARSQQREVLILNVEAFKLLANQWGIRALEHIILIVSIPNLAVIANYRVQIHIVAVDVARALPGRAVPLHDFAVVFILWGNELAPFLISYLVPLFVAACTVQASERQVERAIIFHISHSGLSNVRANAMLGLVCINNLFLRDTELLAAMPFVSVFPGIKLTRYFIIDIGANNLDIGRGTVLGALGVIVRYRPPSFIVLPPSFAFRAAQDTSVGPLLIGRRRLGPLRFRLGKPTVNV